MWPEYAHGRMVLFYSYFMEAAAMNRYLIESPHTEEECTELVKLVITAGYATHFDWGCKAGVHKGWIILEAEDEAQALLAVPTLVRSKATVVRLNKFTTDDMVGTHKKHG
jgi:hypothetical protein